MTKIINIFGGPGSGKSTMAAGVFHKMKEEGYSVELVSEYVKKWAWEGRIPGKYDQIYITGHQSKAEYMLHGKVDFIVTDSPVLLGAFYDNHYNGKSLVEDMIRDYLYDTELNGIEYCNFLIQRSKPFVAAGRFSNEEESKNIDKELKKFLNKRDMRINTIRSGNVDGIFNVLSVNKLLKPV